MHVYDPGSGSRDSPFGRCAQTPIVSGVALLSLALGIGANVAIFSLVNALILKSLPVHEPERLVQLRLDRHQPAQPHHLVHQPAVGIPPRSPGHLHRRRGVGDARFNLNAGGEMRIVPGLFVSGTLLRHARRDADIGRTLHRGRRSARRLDGRSRS